MTWKVLVVSADQQAAELLVKRLKDRGLQAEIVLSGQEAFKQIEQISYDAVIIDSMAPQGDKVDGIAALTALKAQNPDLQIIFLADHANIKKGMDALEFGAFDLVEKPVDIKCLVEKIQEASTKTKLLAEKRAQQEKQSRIEKPGKDVKRVRDLMIPQEEYAAVSQEATLFEAIIALEDAQKNVDQGRDKHRAVLVLNKDYEVVGKVGQLDIICALEPKYAKISNLLESSSDGLNPEFMRTMIADFDLWREPLRDICKQATDIKVIDIMHTPTESEYVREDDTIDHAIHQLVVGRHQSLLVIDVTGKIVGVLKLADVFKSVCDKIKTCRI
jgi:DNA-binding response OmpR family regulator